MKNENIIAMAAALLVVVLGIQAYTTYRLHQRLNQFIEPDTHAEDIELGIPSLKLDDEFVKDRSWNPYSEMQHMKNEMEHMFGKSFSRFHMHTRLGALTNTPDVDLQDKPDRYVVTVNAPGAEESSIQVKLNDRILNISIKTEQVKDEADEKNGKYQYRERFVGEFNRVLTLPGPADSAKLKTEYRNGVLTITVPKK